MMGYFLHELKSRGELLYYFGWTCLILSAVFLVLTQLLNQQVSGTNAWYKPFKFALSICCYSWAMSWYVYELPKFNTSIFAWTTIVLLGFEIVYIIIQAGRGQLSHFNVSTPFYSFMYGLMALAATLVTLYTAYITLLFFQQPLHHLPAYYLWGIRLGLCIFVVFSFEGFVMGSRLSHTIGGADGGPGLPLVNWSTKFGDPRIAHFIGMHALQVIPLLAYYVLKNTKATLILAAIYLLLAIFTLVQALKGKPLFSLNKTASHKNIPSPK